VGYQEIKMKFGKTFSAACLASAFLLALTGCQPQEGPAERAGKEVDKVVDKAGQQIEKAGDSIQDAVKSDKNRR
jgi:hypothetical protein